MFLPPLKPYGYTVYGSVVSLEISNVSFFWVSDIIRLLPLFPNLVDVVMRDVRWAYDDPLEGPECLHGSLETAWKLTKLRALAVR